MENPSPQVVGLRINADREDKGISVEDLADKTGIATVTLYRRLKNGEGLKYPEMVQLSQALDRPISEWVAA